MMTEWDGLSYYLPGGPIGWYDVVSANVTDFSAFFDYWNRCGLMEKSIGECLDEVKALTNHDDAPAKHRCDLMEKRIGECLDEVEALTNGGEAPAKRARR